MYFDPPPVAKLLHSLFLSNSAVTPFGRYPAPKSELEKIYDTHSANASGQSVLICETAEQFVSMKNLGLRFSEEA